MGRIVFGIVLFSLAACARRGDLGRHVVTDRSSRPPAEGGAGAAEVVGDRAPLEGLFEVVRVVEPGGEIDLESLVAHGEVFWGRFLIGFQGRELMVGAQSLRIAEPIGHYESCTAVLRIDATFRGRRMQALPRIAALGEVAHVEVRRDAAVQVHVHTADEACDVVFHADGGLEVVATDPEGSATPERAVIELIHDGTRTRLELVAVDSLDLDWGAFARDHYRSLGLDTD